MVCRDTIQLRFWPNAEQIVFRGNRHPFIDDLPHEIFLEIVQYLCPTDLHAITQVSRYMSDRVMVLYFRRVCLDTSTFPHSRMQLDNPDMYRAALVWARSPAFQLTSKLASLLICDNVACIIWFIQCFPPFLRAISVQVIGPPVKQRDFHALLRAAQQTGCEVFVYAHQAADETRLACLQRQVSNRLHHFCSQISVHCKSSPSQPNVLKFISCDFFDPITRRFIVYVTHKVQDLHLVSDNTENSESWCLLLQELTAPHLTRLTLAGNILAQSVSQFVARHPGISSIRIGTEFDQYFLAGLRKISSACLALPEPRVRQSSILCTRLSNLQVIQASLEVALEILRSTDNPVLTKLRLLPSFEETDYLGGIVECLRRCSAHQLSVLVDDPFTFHEGGSHHQVCNSPGDLEFPATRVIIFLISCEPEEEQDVLVSGKRQCFCRYILIDIFSSIFGLPWLSFFLVWKASKSFLLNILGSNWLDS